MGDDLVFYTNPMSRGRMVRWMLEEIGAPYTTKIVPFGAQMKQPDYLAINPMGKVPALTHGDTTITECAAICAYLADAFPDAGLAPPPGTPERGDYYRWMFFGAGPVEQMVTMKALDQQVPKGKQGMVGGGSLERVVDVLDKHLQENDYFLASGFSASDIYLGSQIAFGMMFGTIETRPSFERYVAQGMARPANKRAREIDDALLEDDQPPAG